MTYTKINYIPNRIIDSNGVGDGGSVYVYQSGTTTTVSLFSDAALSVPVSNPYVVAAGGAVPPLYTSYIGAIRLKVVSTNGTVQDDDPYGLFTSGQISTSLTITGTAPKLVLQSSVTGTGAQGSIRFQDNAATETGYIGDIDGTNDLAFVSNNGGVNILAGSVINLASSGNVLIGGVSGIILKYNAVTKATVSTTGFDVTGALTASGALTITGAAALNGGMTSTSGSFTTTLGVTGVASLNGGMTSTTGAFTGALTSSSPTGGIGYSTGAGGTVTQATSKSTGVTLSKACGQITMNNAALAAATGVGFTVTNTVVSATDTINLNLQSGNATAGTYNYQIDKVSAGSFVIWVKNISAGSLSEALVFNFSVDKGVNA